MVTLPERFWSKVEKTDDCWNWIGAKYRKGYGMLRVDGKCVAAHRMMLGFPQGQVLHHCDNPSCVNPDHLYVGTRSDNMNDMYRRGRQGNRPKGEKHHSARLNWDKVAKIRRKAAQGVANTTLAVEFGVSNVMIGKIVRNHSWKHRKHP
jgi:uncharacterized cupin superfamily protein